MKPRNAANVMHRRREPPDSLDFFATPPWATRALFEHVLIPRGLYRRGDQIWEPACGEGHMSGPMEEYGPVIASDIFDYGAGEIPERCPAGWWKALDFLDERADVPFVDWIVTNPPFNTAEAFAQLAFKRAANGVALLVRLGFIAGQDRFEQLFKPHPPVVVAQFSERVPMQKGGWNPSGSTATDYCWIVWRTRQPDHFVPGHTHLDWIPPECRKDLTKKGDVRRYARLAPAPLLEGPQ